MALPNTIANDQNPNGTKLQENFTYLEAGKGIKTGSLSTLKSFAATDPTVPFLCIDTDTDSVLVYMGKTTVGADGFVVIGGAGGGTADDLVTGDIG